MFAWLEVAVKRGDDVGALIAVNLSLGFLSIFPVPRLQTDTCNDTGHGDGDCFFLYINDPNPAVFIQLMSSELLASVSSSLCITWEKRAGKT